MNSEATTVRLDKYLWACRFYKTRNIAKSMIDGGKVEYNGYKAKSSKNVELNALISLPFGNDKITIKVKALSDIRGPYSVAKELYEETLESIQKRQKAKEDKELFVLISNEQKPNKKQRRDINKFKEQNYL